MGWWAKLSERPPNITDRFPKGMLVCHRLARGKCLIVSGYGYSYPESYYPPDTLKVRGEDLVVHTMSEEEVEPWQG